MNQLQLLPLEELQQTTQPKVAREATIQERFEAFHAQNPQVYAAYRSVALQMVRSGVKQYGISGLTEILRWQFAIQTQGDSFKINNSFRSLYARMLAKNEPELEGFFELRCLRDRHAEAGK